MLFHAHYETMKGHHVYTTTQVLLKDGGKGPVDLASEEYNGCGWESIRNKARRSIQRIVFSAYM